MFRFAVGALSGHGLRTALSMVGVSIGVAAVIILTALGEGARAYVTDEFTSLGTNLLIVVPGRAETTGAIPGIGGVPNDLTIDDARVLAREIRELREIAPVSLGNETVSANGRSRQLMIIGTTRSMMRVRNLSIRRGSYLPDVDWERGAPVAVLGDKVARELFDGADAVGRVIRVGDFRMKVIGVMERRGVSLGVDLDDMVFVPVATGMRMFNRSSLFRILMKLRSHTDVESARARINEILIERHDDEQDFTIIAQDAVLTAFSAIFGALTLAVAGIAAISLSVAGVGIMNVMLVSVSERTHEIGLLKAVGAHGRQILAAFLTEAILLSTLGGLVGLGVGWGAVQALVALYPVLPASPPPWAVASALTVSIGVGALFGVLPAVRATRLDPIQALQKA